MTRFPIALMLAALFAVSPAQADGAIDLAEHEGKVVVVDFWASWCVPCRRSFPWLNAMQKRYADDGLVIIGVNVDNDEQDARGFLRDYPPQFRIAWDRDKSLARRFEVIAMPSSYVIGRDGDILATHLGFKVKKQDDYEAAIRQALQQQP